jgi:hypothetical protein
MQSRKWFLFLLDSSSSQIRIVELASIFDEELNKASYEKLVDLIVAAVGFDFNTNALKLTYQDYDNDAVVVSSTRELTYAIRQFYDAESSLLVTSSSARRPSKIKRQMSRTLCLRFSSHRPCQLRQFLLPLQLPQTWLPLGLCQPPTSMPWMQKISSRRTLLSGSLDKSTFPPYALTHRV